MQVDVNGTTLWFDVEGASLVPDGPMMRLRPTLVLVHGGPGGFDHSYFMPDFGRMAAVAQVVYLDLRGHGRSAWGDVAAWSFEACADDVRAFCDHLGIVRPVVLGHSMGAPIALLYGARHPGHAAALVSSSGFARWDHERLVESFRQVAGDEVAALADRDFAGKPVTEDESARVFAAFGNRLPDEEREQHTPHNSELNVVGMDLLRRLDLLQQLAAVACPVLVSVGELDPVTPVAAAEEVVAALPAGLGRLDVVPGAGHFTWLDQPDHYWPVLLEFVAQAVAPPP
jgi:pimeloyl-ACP methyl ester carboxylesterase